MVDFNPTISTVTLNIKSLNIPIKRSCQSGSKNDNCLQETNFILSFLFDHFVLVFIEIELIYNVVLVSGVQQSDSVIHISILLNILFHYGLLQDIECSSLCYMVGLYCLSILYIVVCIC